MAATKSYNFLGNFLCNTIMMSLGQHIVLKAVYHQMEWPMPAWPFLYRISKMVFDQMTWCLNFEILIEQHIFDIVRPVLSNLNHTLLRDHFVLINIYFHRPEMGKLTKKSEWSCYNFFLLLIRLTVKDFFLKIFEGSINYQKQLALMRDKKLQNSS